MTTNKENTMENQLQLGSKVRDLVTGFEGTVTGMVDYLSGCNQALVVPKVTADGAFRQGEWFDVQRLQVRPGKPVALQNGATPGADRAPSRRS